MSRKPVLFFDFDDTLSEHVVFLRQYARAVGDILAPRYGGDADEWAAAATDMLAALADDYTLHFDGNPLNHYNQWLARARADAMQFLFDARGLQVPAEPVSFALALQDDALSRCCALFPNAYDVVRGLSHVGHTLYLASGNDSQHLRSALAGAGLEACFRECYGPDLLDCAKEGPEFYARLFANVNVPPADALVIDNDPTVCWWARQTGAQVVQTRLLPAQNLEPAGNADAVCTDLNELPAMLHAFAR